MILIDNMGDRGLFTMFMTMFRGASIVIKRRHHVLSRSIHPNNTAYDPFNLDGSNSPNLLPLPVGVSPSGVSSHTGAPRGRHVRSTSCVLLGLRRPLMPKSMGSRPKLQGRPSGQNDDCGSPDSS